MSRYGLDGFDGKDSDPDFAIGSVTGVRWWHLRMPGGPDGLPVLTLKGVRDGWAMGENIAQCGMNQKHSVPDEECGCGFWAYWQAPDAPNPHGFDLPILGIVQGYGHTLIGEKGFRCAKARIVALHFAHGAQGLIDYDGETPDCLRGRGEMAVKTWQRIVGKKYVPPSEDAALAKLAVLEILLEERYGVPVYGTQGLMLAKHPPTRDYLPPSDQPELPAKPTLTIKEAKARMRAKERP